MPGMVDSRVLRMRLGAFVAATVLFAALSVTAFAPDADARTKQRVNTGNKQSCQIVVIDGKVKKKQGCKKNQKSKSGDVKIKKRIR